MVVIGGFTGSAAFTTICSVIGLALAIHAFVRRNRVSGERYLRGRTDSRWTLIPWSLVVFLIYGVSRLLVAPSATGLQNVLLYFLFAASIYVVGASTGVSASQQQMTLLTFAAVISTAIYLISLAAGWGLIGPRSFAAAGLIFMAVSIANRSENPLVRLAPYVFLIAIVLSLSRSASAIGLAILVFLSVRGRRGWRILKSLGLLIALSAVGVAVVWSYPPFRDRFFGGDNAIALDNGLTFNTSGRDQIWDVVLQSASEALVFGKGPGSAQELITSRFAGSIAHPHNEYLRILHDFGVIGLGLFVWALLWLLAAIYSRAAKYDEPQHWAAFIALFATLALAFTDNPFIYQFVMLPLGVVVGSSLSSRPPHRGRVRPALSTQGLHV